MYPLEQSSVMVLVQICFILTHLLGLLSTHTQLTSKGVTERKNPIGGHIKYLSLVQDPLPPSCLIW